MVSTSTDGERSGSSGAPTESTLAGVMKEKPGLGDEQLARAAEQDGRMNEEIHELARRLTSHAHGADAELFPHAEAGPLDPKSGKFNAKMWAKAFYDIRTKMSNGQRPRTSGVAFKNLDVFGFGTPTDFQKSVANVYLGGLSLAKKLTGSGKQRIDILRNMEGLVRSGEMLAVLGPPGSGCSTFLKTIAGDTHGFYITKESIINYQGISPKQMSTAFRGEAIYTAEVDHHFPHLTVGDTLYFAARSRCPKNLPAGVSKKEYAEHIRDVTMAMFGISHTINTRVGDDFVRGVSGGERKRVTIAEASLGYSPLQCWDNSTRGLDSANATEFCRTLRVQADTMGCSSCVAIYQAPQPAIDLFDKVVVLYEGRQIFFGKTSEARSYFENLGFICPSQQTTADFLTSMTSASERVIRPGWEGKTPRSPDEFAQAWKTSDSRARLLQQIDDYLEQHPFNGEHYDSFLESRKTDQSDMQRSSSPFTVSYGEQMGLTLWRSWVMLKNDPSISLTMLISNLFEALIVSSIFYNLPTDTSSFFKRSILLFFVMIINAFGSILEIMTLYAKRKIVEKQARYAFYHPSAEALSAMIVDLPYKVVNTLIINIILYFMSNLRREPGPFFFFLLFTFMITLCMSMMFRLIGSVTKSVAQALAPASVILLAITLNAGFAIPPPYMEPWIGWCRWINPLYYGLESLFLNEFIGREYPCTSLVPTGPGYESVGINERACAVTGAIPGESFVRGDNHLLSSYGYENSHRWRNLGVIIALAILFMGLHLLASEYVASERSKGEVLVFTRKSLKKRNASSSVDIESGESDKRAHTSRASDTEAETAVEKQTAVFHWKNVCYDIKIKSEERRILDNVDGWVKPGTLTALMGVSGAGKTTLLDVLADRVTMGVVTGDMLVDGNLRDDSFQRKTGYVQQQDIHLHTSTVREALTFSALLRQPRHYSDEEKIAYVDTVIKLLGMEEYSDAVIGVPGEGLNVEQRKRLTIGVEVAARPQLLLFLDEPTSGLDSQTSWSICNLMEKLTNSGQAILCTIHQPSAILFQRFDRLLLLAKGGKTVYFGDIGKNSKILVDYFTRNGAIDCPADVNPAEYMLEVIGAAPGAHTDIDWPAVWRASPEYQAVQDELSRLSSNKATVAATPQDASSLAEFAAPLSSQMTHVTKRIFQQYWRSPGYLYSKALLSFGAALFIGLSFINSRNTQRGLQNQMFGVFIFMTIFGQLLEQIMPVFVTQRTLYEARERPSKAYSWKAFMVANISVEIAWNSVMAVASFVCWYFPIGLYRNAYATNAVDSRGITMFLHVWMFFTFTSTFSHMMIAGFPTADEASGVANLFFIMMLTFCGVLSGPDQLPRFWIFMYRVNPFTYMVEGFLGTSLANTAVECADNEWVTFNAPSNQTCAQYMSGYISMAGGALAESSKESSSCVYCPLIDSNVFLKGISVDFNNRWRNFGFLWVFCIFNICAAIFLYWFVRVPKRTKVKKD